MVPQQKPQYTSFTPQQTLSTTDTSIKPVTGSRSFKAEVEFHKELQQLPNNYDAQFHDDDMVVDVFYFIIVIMQ